MSRKHFELIAEAIRSIKQGESRRIAADKLADVCRECNPRFDYGRFMKACGL